ncbi:hypothetical protein [Streptomyces sp. NBC_00239]|uniref:hypothetical protein n=1 Tax=Streptomyces sp. NBC_00239 TaxID=2903640 RepID=UPI002E285E28|nr:hypothetical protein [Streptomyces sp. NBC_00239]
MPGSSAPAKRRKGRPVTSAAPSPGLSPDDLRNDSTESLIARGAAYARAYDRIKSDETTLLRNIAAVLVCIRERCLTEDGRPDWTGRTNEYRVEAGRVYAEAGIPRDSADSIQAAVRYHVGKIIREYVSAEELSDYGLKALSPMDSHREYARTQSALALAARIEADAAPTTVTASVPASKKAPAVKAGKAAKEALATPAPEVPARAVADHIRLTTGAAKLLQQLSAEVIASMTDGQRARLHDELGVIQTLAASLRRETKKHRSED